MTYSSGGPGYPGTQQSGAYAPTAQFTKVDDRPSRLPVYLLAAVAVLGLAAYLLTFGPVWKDDSSGSAGAAAGSVVVIWSIIAALFAALFAVVAMLPKQGRYGPVVTATAVVAFLLAIWTLIKGADAADWALIVIVVVLALQTIAAIAALLLEAGVITPPAPRPKYDQYQQYGGYYGQQFGQPQTAPQQPPGPQSFGQPQGYQQYGGYPGGPPSGGFPAQPHPQGPPTPPTGFPTYAQPPSAPAAPEQQQPASQQEQAQQPSAEQPSPSGPPAVLAGGVSAWPRSR